MQTSSILSNFIEFDKLLAKFSGIEGPNINSEKENENFCVCSPFIYPSRCMKLERFMSQFYNNNKQMYT